MNIDKLVLERQELGKLLSDLSDKRSALNFEYNILEKKIDKVLNLITAIQGYCQHTWEESVINNHQRWRTCSTCKKLESF